MPTPISKSNDGDLTVRLFAPGDEAAFKRLNEQWIVRYFRLEEKDVETLSHPRPTIIDKGGQIFIATLDGAAVGCCALVPMDDPASYELAKMAVDEQMQGRGVGRAVMNAAIEWARRHGVTRLWLETNHVLTPAIRLYESCGFRHIPSAQRISSEYQRSDVQMDLRLSAGSPTPG